MTTKLLLAAPRRGGIQRQDAVTRLLRARMLKWQAGKDAELWTQIRDEFKSRNAKAGKRTRQGDSILTNDLSEAESSIYVESSIAWIAMPSRACNLLCSRGVFQYSDVILGRVQELFPPAPSPSTTLRLEVSDYHIDDEELMKIITRWPKGLAPGPSGIRGEHLRVAKPQGRWGNGGLCALEEVVEILTTEWVKLE